MSENVVTNNAAESRYEIHVDGVLAGFSEYADAGGVLVMPHTVVFDEFGGQGLAAILVTGALDDVRSNNQQIRPDCEYIQGFLEKHPDYQDLVA